MNISLPEIINFQQVYGQGNGWADHYGALYVAASYCDIDLPPTPFPHLWHHGCMGPWTRFASQLSYNVPPDDKKKFLVARKDEEEILKASGYNTAQAIGLPAVYVSDTSLKRNPNTLLIMPQHTLVGIELATPEKRREYVLSLKPFLNEYEVVAACLSYNCICNGYFIEDMQELGIEIIVGACTSDLNACLRIRCLMEQFESMTTNGWGSHVAYALYYGMKVSIFGERFEITDNELSKDISWSTTSDEDRYQILVDYYKGSEALLSPFRLDPTEAEKNIDLGSFLVGADNKISPDEMKELFGW
jgi:hypothetical protein